MDKGKEGKAPYELIPFKALHEVVAVLAFGKEKYSANQWREVEDTQGFLGAALRHITAWQRGHKVDDETGIDHLAHAACNLLFIQELKYIKEEKENGRQEESNKEESGSKEKGGHYCPPYIR